MREADFTDSPNSKCDPKIDQDGGQNEDVMIPDTKKKKKKGKESTWSLNINFISHDINSLQHFSLSMYLIAILTGTLIT